jgi:hypothetical protein
MFSPTNALLGSDAGLPAGKEDPRMSKQTNGTKLDLDDFIGRLYLRLIGARVEAFRWDGEYPVFTVRLADGQRREIAIQQDAEGNGPGFIDGLDD